MNLQEFFEKENINIDANNYIVKSFGYGRSQDNEYVIDLVSYKLSECLYWDVCECYDKFLNKKKCLCLAFSDSMEKIWSSLDECRKELNRCGYELFIIDDHLIYGSLDEYDTLNDQDIKELVSSVEEDWFMFLQIKDKLIFVIDDEFNYDEGYWMYKDHLTCYMYNVNLTNNINKVTNYINNKLNNHICNR